MIRTGMNKFWFFVMAAVLCGCGREEARRPEPRDTPTTPAPSAVHSDPRPAIVCFGDSLTAGYGLQPGESYPDALQRELDRRGIGYRVVNQGVSGDTSQGGLSRLPMVIAEKPEIVVLELGANDGLRGLPVAGTQRNLEQMIEALQGAGAKMVLAGITLPPNYGPEYIRRFEGMYKDLAKKYDLPLIPFLLEGVAGDSRLMQSDGLHPTAEGARLVAQAVLKALEPLLHPRG